MITARAALHLALHLARFHHLPHEIVKKIFSRDFIQQSEYYSFYNNSTPKFTFHLRMKMLNQTVSALYPEYNLPWYYEELCVEYSKKHPWLENT